MSRRKVRDISVSDENPKNSPSIAGSPFRIMQVVDKRIDRETETLKSLLRESDKKYENQIEIFKSLLIEFENRLLSELDKRMLDMKRELVAITERVTSLETVTGEIDKLKNEIKSLKIQSLKNANAIVACDLRINGIPYNNGENVLELFENICKMMKISTPGIKSIFRLQNKNNKTKFNSPDAVIIVKFFSPYDKNFFLKSVGLYKKLNNSYLMLKNLGFQSEKTFNINENLTNTNYKIFREAVLLKKRQKLHSAYTFRGLVYVKRVKDDDPICIEDMDALDFFRGQPLHPDCSHSSII